MQEYRQFNGEIKVLQKQNEWLYDVELWMLKEEEANRNNWRYPVDRATADLFVGVPLLTAYVMGGKVNGDGHNFREYTDPETGEPRGDFRGADAERIVGSLSENPADIRIEESDGYKWLVGRGSLWQWYCGELCDQIRNLAEQGRTMPVSIETLVSESHMDGDVEVMDKFIVLGVTILGIHVEPAVEGARIAALQALESDFKELKLRAASYAGNAAGEPASQPNNDPNDGANAAPEETKSKGVNKTLTLFTKRQLAELSKRFEGYTLLGAQKDEETGAVTVKMRNDAYDTYSYTMQSESETIAPERIIATNARIDLGDGISMDALDMMESLNADVRRLSADKSAVEKELADTKAALNAMQEAETKRRKAAAVAAVNSALAKFNENRENKVDATAVAQLVKNAEDGCYDDCVNAEGEWCGDELAERDCLAECAKQEMEAQAKAAANKKNAYVWDKHKVEQHDDGSVGALLKRLNINK